VYTSFSPLYPDYRSSILFDGLDVTKICIELVNLYILNLILQTICVNLFLQIIYILFKLGLFTMRIYISINPISQRNSVTKIKNIMIQEKNHPNI
jgi:hypothetical protein